MWTEVLPKQRAAGIGDQDTLLCFGPSDNAIIIKHNKWKNKTKQCLSPTGGSWALLTALPTNQDTPVAGHQLLGHKEVSRINTSPVLLLAARVLTAPSLSVTITVKCFLCDSITLKNWRKVPVVAWPSRHAVVSVKTVQMDSTVTLCKHTCPLPKKRKHSQHSGCVIDGLHCTVCISLSTSTETSSECSFSLLALSQTPLSDCFPAVQPAASIKGPALMLCKKSRGGKKAKQNRKNE